MVNLRAARSAFWLAFVTLERPGLQAQAAGWLARAQRLVDEAAEPCVEQGWLLCAAARQRVAAGDAAGALDAFTQAAEVGARFADRDLIHLARHGRGHVLLLMYFVGLHFQYAFSSDMIHGVGRDAERIACAIAERNRSLERRVAAA